MAATYDIYFRQWGQVLADKADKADRTLELFQPHFNFLKVHGEHNDIPDHSLLAEQNHVLKVAVQVLLDLLIGKV